MNQRIHDHGEDDPIPFELTAAEREDAQHKLAEHRFKVDQVNAVNKARELYMAAERAYHHHNRTLDGQS